ncbi:hypothetical protein ARSEF4850_003706, partial [Beauveria asiatica]
MKEEFMDDKPKHGSIRVKEGVALEHLNHAFEW